MKHLILTIMLILMSYITIGASLEEFTFIEQGYEDFYIKGADNFDCKRYEFLYTLDLNADLFPVFSLKAVFSPKTGQNAEITIYFNDDNSIANLKANDFLNGVARINIAREKLGESNSIRVCGKTSFSVNTIKINANSTFGTYFAPYIPEENGFELTLETYRAKVGIPFKITATTRNYGSEDTEISVSYRREELEEKLEEISILKGETAKIGVLPKCVQRNDSGECVKPGEYVMEYTAIANKAVPMTLLPAILTYKNTFGEAVKIESNRPSFEALELEHALSVQTFVNKDNPKVGEEIIVKVKVTNNSTAKIELASIKLKTGLEATKSNSAEIFSIEPGTTKEATFTMKGISEGEYVLGCEAEYNSKILECEENKLKLEGEEIGVEIMSGIALALVALIMFLYYHFKK